MSTDFRNIQEVRWTIIPVWSGKVTIQAVMSQFHELLADPGGLSWGNWSLQALCMVSYAMKAQPGPFLCGHRGTQQDQSLRHIPSLCLHHACSYHPHLSQAEFKIRVEVTLKSHVATGGRGRMGTTFIIDQAMSKSIPSSFSPSLKKLKFFLLNPSPPPPVFPSCHLANLKLIPSHDKTPDVPCCL